jgi:hypothetical protein
VLQGMGARGGGGIEVKLNLSSIVRASMVLTVKKVAGIPRNIKHGALHAVKCTSSSWGGSSTRHPCQVCHA